MPDQTVWDIPVGVIVLSRTAYYAKHDGFKEGSKDWKDEWDYAMGDAYEITDWASNNMNWKDVKMFAIQVPQKGKPSVYDDAWINVEMEVVEKVDDK